LFRPPEKNLHENGDGKRRPQTNGFIWSARKPHLNAGKRGYALNRQALFNYEPKKVHSVQT